MEQNDVLQKFPKTEEGNLAHEVYTQARTPIKIDHLRNN